MFRRKLTLVMITAAQIAGLDFAHATRTCVDLFYDSPFVKVVDSDRLRLQNADGSIALFEANSYYRQTEFRPLVETVLARRADVQSRMDEALTNGHARNGNTFQKKNPKTGHYDIEFAPRVNGAVVPLNRKFFDEQIQSMAPVARSLRFLLQRVFSSGDMFVRYTSAEKTARDRAFGEIVEYLEIGSLPLNEQRRLVDIVAENIYFEKAMIDPSLKDYGFLPVVGFDAAIETLRKVTAVYYEFNSGTPSGLSNNIQLLEVLRQKDPKLFATFKDMLLEDRTFEILHDTIRSNAESFTGAKDGISVIVGPGSFNAANPDVSAISIFSGMPLVETRDLYVGRDGWVYLNTGKVDKHPKVTGIYGRIEESAFLNSAKEGIGWITPESKDNDALGKKWGLPLRNGVVYDWKLDNDGQKVGVHLDPQGRPRVVQFSLGEIGRDPSRSSGEGSFAAAIRNRKLYFSGLGGRVIDDKRVFEIIYRHLGKRFQSKAGPMAGPPRTLTDGEVQEFYSRPEKFVVKVPDESGGVGVYLGPLLSKTELTNVVDKVKADREKARRTGQQPVLTIQDFTTAAVMTTPIENNGKWKWGTTVPDWRFFVFMDAKGEVRAGANSFLVRAAKRLSPSTNTSQGAGYGIGVILDPAPGRRARDPNESVLPKVDLVTTPVSVTAREHLKRYLSMTREVLEIARSGEGAEARLREMAPENPYNEGFYNPNMKWNRLEILVQLHKEVIGLLGPEHSAFITTLKRFQANEMTLAQLSREVGLYRSQLLRSEFQRPGVKELVTASLAYVNLPGQRAKSQLRPFSHDFFASRTRAGQPRAQFESFLQANVVLRRTEPRVIREGNWFGKDTEIVHVATVERTTDPTFNRLLEELHEAGGELRYVRQRVKGGEFIESPPPAEFGISVKGKPTIDIDLNQSQLLAGVAHEMTHFRDWLPIYRAALQEGVSPAEAAKIAVKRMTENVDFQRDSEVRAVEAEIQFETTMMNSPFMAGVRTRPIRFWESINGYRYISRISYPDMVAVSRVLSKLRWEKAEITAADRVRIIEQGHREASKYLVNLVKETIRHREKTISYLRGVATKYGEHPDGLVRQRVEEARAEADRLATSSIFEIVFRQEELHQFANRGILDLTVEVYRKVVADLAARNELPTDVAAIEAKASPRLIREMREQQQQQQQQQQ